MKRPLRSFLRDESGATAIEYAFIAMMISVAIIGGGMTIGGELDAFFQSLGTAIPTN